MDINDSNRSVIAATFSENPTSAQLPLRAASGSHAKRTEASLVRFTPEEFLVITERARACGLVPARFIRETALGAVPKARRAAANAALVRELARIGTDLRQLAKEPPLPVDAATKAQLETLLAELLDVIRGVE